jgi:hypothetical protein
MKKIILKTIAAMLILAAVFSCKKDEPAELTGTSWVLTGIVDVKTGKQRDLSPKGRTHRFYFTSNNTASEFHVDVNPAHLVLFPRTCIYINPSTDILLEDEFYDVIDGVGSYELKGSELRLFYNNKKNYLLYVRLSHY